MPTSGYYRLQMANRVKKANAKFNRTHKSSSAVGKKIGKIMSEGVRWNTHKPVSASNRRRKVSRKQAIAIALSMAKKGRA